MIILTIDIEWAPDYMLDFCFGLLSDTGLKTTIFATHDSSKIKDVSSEIEVGLHPDINSLGEAEEKISELKRYYPEARCVRNHRLVHSSVFTRLYKKYGLSVTSNYLMIDQDDVRPIPMLYGIKEYPIFFMDDIYLATHDKIEVGSLIEKLRKTEGLKVIAFHPIHIYLNSGDIGTYETVKGDADDKERIDSAVFSGTGIGTIFREILSTPWLKKRVVGFPI